MSEVRIELIPRMVPVDESTFAGKAATVQRMGELGQIDPATGQVPGEMQDGWLACVNGVEVPVVTYGVEPGAEGAQALVSLLIAADSVRIGDPSLGSGEPQVRPAAPVKSERSYWGAPSPDPREHLMPTVDQNGTSAAPGAGVSLTVTDTRVLGRLDAHLRTAMQRRGDGLAGVAVTA